MAGLLGHHLKPQSVVLKWTHTLGMAKGSKCVGLLHSSSLGRAALRQMGIGKHCPGALFEFAGSKFGACCTLGKLLKHVQMFSEIDLNVRQ